ncbi:serine-rich adhesin for platelets isoform X2 [Hoplias malabaricus]|uniref:serine-rich adhesin for platelets isoform X2 n=1 Tax=Hoplias malabaricus TaxID=27720 RepID=UPI003462E968
MDTPAGYTFGPVHPASTSRSNGDGNAELSNSSKQSPMQSNAARFQIRTATERQRMLQPSKSMKNIVRLEGEMTENGRRSSYHARKEVLRVRPHSPPSPDSVTEKRTPVNQGSVAKAPVLPTGSETNNDTQGKPDGFGKLSSSVRGRTEWKRANVTNRSKSLDWRRSDRGNENLTSEIRNTDDFIRSPRIRSESLEENGLVSSPKTNELSSPSNRISSRIQAFNVIGQGKQDKASTIPPITSGSSSVKMGRVTPALDRVSFGQSFPSRLKLKENQDITEDKKCLWRYSGQSSPKPDQGEVQLRSQVSGSKVSEITGNQSIMDRIGKLYRFNASEDNTDANSRDLTRAKRNSAPVGDWFSGSDVPDFSSVHKRLTSDSTLSSPSSSHGQLRRVSHGADKADTFPRKLSKKEAIAFTSVTNTVHPETTGSVESPRGTDPTANTEWDGRTNSLNRARSLNFTPAVSRTLGTESSFPAGDSNTPRHEDIGAEVEREKSSDNSNHVKGTETHLNKQPYSPQETHMFTQPRHKLFRSVTVDHEKYRDREDVFGLGSSTLPRMKREGMQEKGQAPFLDSVRNTIHKFEALAQQNQALRPRRTFSVPEKTKPAAGVSKSNSDKSLNEWKGAWHTRSLREHHFSKSEEPEVVGTSDLSGPAQTSTDKAISTLKPQKRASYIQEPVVAQKLVEKFEECQEDKDTLRDDMKTTTVPRPMDEADLAKVSQIPKNVESAEDKVKPVTSQISKNKSTELINIPDPDTKDISTSRNKGLLDASDGASLQIQDHPPSTARTKDANALQTSGSIQVLPNSVSFTSAKSDSTLLTTTSTVFKPPSVASSDSTVKVPVVSSTQSDLSNISDTTRDEKVTAKVSRWITYDADGDTAFVNEDVNNEDEDDDGTERGYDSDSGESSVTITSNMSQSEHRSFSLSLADLCNLGGLDYPLSDENASNDEESWMSRRSASLSSDISVLSSVTLLGTEELDCLLEDVRGLGDEAIQNCEDVQVVVLHKEVGRGLGFTVAGGVDQNKPVTVHKVFPSGVASQEGSIQEGYEVLSINGTALHNSAHYEALRTLRKARGRGMAVVVLRRGTIKEIKHSTKGTLEKPVGKEPGSRVRVTLTKSNFDLGFSLEGGVGSSVGDKPLTVQRLFQGGPVGKVYPGDEVVEVEGQSLKGLRRLEAWNLIKRLPPGPVEVLLYRPHLPR